MKLTLQRFSAFVACLNTSTSRLTAWLTVVLVLVVCVDVVARKIFNFSKVWITDLEWHLFALIFLLSAGYTLLKDRHVRVDLFYHPMPEKDKAKVNFWGTLLFLVPWCLVVIWYGWGYALQSFRIREGATDPGGLPARYIIKFAIVGGASLLLLQALAVLLQTWHRIIRVNRESQQE